MARVQCSYGGPAKFFLTDELDIHTTRLCTAVQLFFFFVMTLQAQVSSINARQTLSDDYFSMVGKLSLVTIFIFDLKGCCMLFAAKQN